MSEKKLHLSFSGRIIDHLGIQMYQSPTAAIAEMIANSWDADATSVEVEISQGKSSSSTIVVKDNGIGMTFQECEDRFLNVGYCRRGKSAIETTPRGRPVLGRKGIGKFAGFGIASEIQISTVSQNTGEETSFTLHLDQLRDEKYSGQGSDLAAQTSGPSTSKIAKHGTTITLKRLTLKRAMSTPQFRRSMARKFLLQSDASGFTIKVNSEKLPDEASTDVEFEFPRDYEEGEAPSGLVLEESGWGRETIAAEQSISWRIRFYKEPINDEELNGVSVFAGIKLAQRPFYFNLSGGLGGQHAQEYLSGTVRADYLDRLT